MRERSCDLLESSRPPSSPSRRNSNAPSAPGGAACKLRRSCSAEAIRSIAVCSCWPARLPRLAGCGDDNKDGDSGATRRPTGHDRTTDATASGESGRASRSRSHGRRRRKRTRAPSFRLASDKTYTATVVTSCGTFEIELDSKDAPRTGGSFVTLARKGFYDGLVFHRIVTGFVIQGGDPTGDGQGGPGYTVREAPPDDIVYSEGVVAMAKARQRAARHLRQPVLRRHERLRRCRPDYALLGRVKKGLDVVHAIEVVPAGPDERPVEPVVIEKIDVRVDRASRPPGPRSRV